MLKVLIISTFGPNIRGISPYSDSLSKALADLNTINLSRTDYKKAFPSFLLPKNTNYNAANNFAHIDYIKPSTWDVIGDKDIDIVHIQYWSPAFLPIIFAIIKKSKKHSIKVILTWHNPSPHENLPLLAYFEKRLISICDSIICHTNSGADIIRAILPKKSISTIHHGCEVTGTRKPTIKDYDLCNLSADSDYILYFGNIRPYKGVDVLLDAWKIIAPMHPGTKLIIAGRLWENNSSILSAITHKISGTSAYSALIKNKLNEQNNSVISDIQFIPQEKLLSYLHISKLVIFPYLSFESQSGAASIAAAHGAPILVTNVGGLKDLVINNDFISRDLSAKGLASLIENRLNTYQHSWKKEQLDKAKSHDWHSCAKLHLNTYEEALGR